jgi:NAD+ synthetase
MIKLAIAQIRPIKADYAANVRRVGGVFAEVASGDARPDLVVFPECAMSAYYIEGGVREVAVTAGTLFKDLLAQHSASGVGPVDVVVGFYEEFRNRYFNSAMYATLGGSESRIRHVHRKVFLPTYGLFDEARFVHPGDSVRAFDTGWGRAAMLVCEDVWHSITGTLAALDGAQVVVVPSAAPARGVRTSRLADSAAAPRPASVVRWERLIQHTAAENGVFVALAQPVGFEGGKGLQGGSTIVGPDGSVLVAGPVFEEALVTAELELGTITRIRAEEPLLADLDVQLSNLLGSQMTGYNGPAEYDDGDAACEVAEPAVHAEMPVVVPEFGDDPLAIDCELTARWLVLFLRDEVMGRRKFEKALVGLSGGVDSSLTATLAARAFGAENVIGVRMPYRFSSTDSLEHAAQVAEQLGIQLITVDITAAVDGYLDAVADDASPRRRGNVMARLRMVTLFDLSAKYQALPLGTGNKTERLLGYFTWHADDSPPVNPLGDLFKTQVTELARHVGVPPEILSKPATADLVEGQTDEGDLGISYASADRILWWLLKGLSCEEIIALGFPATEVDLVNGKLQGTHWKRRLPTVAMLSYSAIGESYLRPVDY